MARVQYKGKIQRTMAQYEALTTLEQYADYDIIDHPDTYITNAQMTYALICVRLFPAGDTYICSDNGTYTQGHIYRIKVNGSTKSWEDITASAGDLSDYVKKTVEGTSYNTTIDRNEEGSLQISAVNNDGTGSAVQCEINPEQAMIRQSFTPERQETPDSMIGGLAPATAVWGYQEQSGEYRTFVSGIWNKSPGIGFKTDGGSFYGLWFNSATKKGYYVPDLDDASKSFNFENPDPNQEIATKGDLTNKQDKLTAGTGIKIENNTISASLSVQPLYKHELSLNISIGNQSAVGIYHYLSNSNVQITNATSIDDNFNLNIGSVYNSDELVSFDTTINKSGSNITITGLDKTFTKLIGTLTSITDTVTQLI